MIEEIAMIAGLTELLKYFRDERHYRSKNRKEALIAIQNALQKTQQYISLRDNQNKPRDTTIEHELSTLWSTAAIHAREFSPDFAQRLHLKGNFWLNPEEWEFDEIYDAGIKIERINMEVNDLLIANP